MHKPTMKRKQVLKTLLAGLVVSPVRAAAPATDFQQEFQKAWKRSRDYTLTIFNQMPEEHLNFKPTPEMFSFRMQFVHCMIYTTAQLASRLNVKDPYETAQGWNQRSKADVAAELGRFYDWVQQTVATQTSAQLSKMQEFVGEELTGPQLFYALENHIIHHRGQGIVYLRLKGITPEGYFGW
ncbi:DinB family protein [Siphonobacter sp.]|uniref:DinB family protein n=1 Tax=Siphonobacter sp. TaxID=1869184 RepID=UPI003B3B0199